MPTPADLPVRDAGRPGPPGGSWRGHSSRCSDEAVVLDGHSFADEGVAGNLAVLAEPGILLDFDEGADLGVVADFTAVEVDELRQDDPFAQLDVGSDADVVAQSA